jgi:nucleoside-diphosphate-sugar epimerase
VTITRVLITGNRGYVGSVMAPIVQNAGFDVVGLDVDYYRGCDLAPLPGVPTIEKDVRDVELDDLRGFDAVIHLAALSNDPIGNLNADWTDSINLRATRRLGELAREAGVRRFLFASSCIMYGLSEGAEVDETSPLSPQTDYARSKVEGEAALRELATDGFSPVFIRNGTMYGLSPRMRFDTVLNSLVGAALTTGRITVLGDGKPWRPVVHVRDVARGFVAMLTAPAELVHNEAYNLGTDALNTRVRDLATAVQRAVPSAELEVLSRPDADQRTYRTSFAKFADAFPRFAFDHTPATGAADVADALRAVGLTHEQYTSDAFTRLKRLDHLIADGRLDAELRWRRVEVPMA